MRMHVNADLLGYAKPRKGSNLNSASRSPLMLPSGYDGR